MNTTRIPQPVLERFGLFAIIESKRVVLPLKGVECDFSIISGVLEVSMTQIFRQENLKPLDCEYLFPLPADASVFACEADVNGRIIRAQVREREEARRIAGEKKAAGYRTALVESERDNLFTLSLGNVQPGDLVVIQLKYFQTLRSLGDSRSVEIPFCPGVRYIPGKPLVRSNRGKGVADDTDQVPDASRITPVRIDAEHPDVAYIEVRGTLDGAFVTENSLVSPSHPIVVNRTGEQLRITLADKGEVPDRDFVLRWSERNAGVVASRAWLREQGAETYALLEVRAPKQASAERAPVDFYFLVDRSGSMAGQKWNKAIEALQNCLRVLGSADRGMITFFESHFVDFAERPLPIPQLLNDPEFQTVAKLGTAGGTEMGPALKHVLEMAMKYSQGRDKNLILITDAQIGNEAAILELAKTISDLPVHCFGIDIALNDSLLLALCRQQGGTFHSLNPNDDIQQAVTGLGRTLGQPVLLELKLSEGWELAERRIPNLYAGQIHYLSARSKKGTALAVTARTASSQTVQIAFASQAASVAAPYLFWSRARIQRLLAEGDEKGAVALSTQSNFICPLTAFIAWDESEKVPVANRQLIQPVMELAEVQFCLSAPRVGAAEACRGGAPAAPMHAAERPVGDSLFRKLFKHKTHAASPSQDATVPDELDIKRELSDLCHRIGVPDWQPLIKAIFDWIAESAGAERARRVSELHDLFKKIKALAPAHLKPGDAIQSRIHRLLKTFAEKLPVKK